MERPKWNTAPIRCGRTECKWRGYEGQLASKKEGIWTYAVCPTCGCREYMFMTPGEIKAWERKKAKERVETENDETTPINGSENK